MPIIRTIKENVEEWYAMPGFRPASEYPHQEDEVGYFVRPYLHYEKGDRVFLLTEAYLAKQRALDRVRKIRMFATAPWHAAKAAISVWLDRHFIFGFEGPSIRKVAEEYKTKYRLIRWHAL